MLPNKKTSIFALLFLVSMMIWILLLYADLSLERYKIPIYELKRITGQSRANYQASRERVEVINYPNWRYITAYTPSPDETDDTHCISASGLDVCQALKKGKKIVATNELSLGSKVKIAGVVYEVQDRTNSRYQYRYDILMATKQQAYKWGVKILNVEFL